MTLMSRRPGGEEISYKWKFLSTTDIHVSPLTLVLERFRGKAWIFDETFCPRRISVANLKIDSDCIDRLNKQKICKGRL